jgi:hypothetical protein
MTTPLPRIAGRLGQIIDLNVSIFRNGILTDPFAIRRVRIYRSAVADENLIAQFNFLPPGDPDYPSPAVQVTDTNGPVPGQYILPWDVPISGIPTPDIFFDVWDFIADDCTTTGGIGSGGTATGLDACLDDEELFISQCGKFWLFPDGFFLDDGLQNLRLDFEQLDVKLYQPEIRTIEVGLMPLPLYDYDFNYVAPIMAQLTGTFTLMSENEELLLDKVPMTLGLRQGTFRSNPFNLMYQFDTNAWLKGTYKFRVAVTLPNGETRVSPDFPIMIS